MSGKRILVTGSKGYLGARLMQQLSGASALEADVTDRSSLANAFSQADSTDVVMHLAAANEIICANNFDRGVAVNCLGTRHVIEAAAARGVARVIFFSTIHVYGEPSDGATITESTSPDPIHAYGMTKLMAEQLCKEGRRKHGFDLAIVRLSNSVGAPADPAIDRWSLVMLDLCRQAHEKRALTLRSSGVQRRDFISIDDVVEAVRLLLSASSAQLREPVFNVGSGASVRIHDIATWVQDEYRLMYGESLPMSAAQDSGAAPASFSLSIGKIQRLGFVPRTDLRQEIRNTLKFCEQFRSVRT
jgi:UDP-glucose 4-epimerase